MPLVGLGTWELSGDDGYRAVRHALEVGYRHLDTATMYANEDMVGRAIRDSGVPREQIFVTTKLPPGHTGRERRRHRGEPAGARHGLRRLVASALATGG